MYLEGILLIGAICSVINAMVSDISSLIPGLCVFMELIIKLLIMHKKRKNMALTVIPINTENLQTF